MKKSEKSITRVMSSLVGFMCVSIFGYILAMGYIIPALLKAFTIGEKPVALSDFVLTLAPVIAYVIAAIAVCMFVRIFKKLEPYQKAYKTSTDVHDQLNGLISYFVFGFKVSLVLVLVASVMVSITITVILLGAAPSSVYLSCLINVPNVILPFVFVIFLIGGFTEELKKMNWKSFRIYLIKKIRKIKPRWEFKITWHLNKVYSLTISSKYTFPFCSVRIWRFDLNTPDENLEKIRKSHNRLYLVKFYDYCLFITTMIVFLCWFAKEVRIKPAPAEKIMIGYLITFGIVSITLLIFFLIKKTEERLEKSWKVAIAEKFEWEKFAL